jgi:acetolactate synthase small subunit
MTTQKQLIEKLEELVKAYKVSDWTSVDKLQSEIAALKSQIEQEGTELHPVDMEQVKSAGNICKFTGSCISKSNGTIPYCASFISCQYKK